jgi:hypothetical protein
MHFEYGVKKQRWLKLAIRPLWPYIAISLLH